MAANIPDELKKLWAMRDMVSTDTIPPAVSVPHVVLLDEPAAISPVLDVLEDDSADGVDLPPAGILSMGGVCNADIPAVPRSVGNNAGVLSIGAAGVVESIKLHAVQNVLVDEMDLSSYEWRRTD
jgi:hypothetical protein